MATRTHRRLLTPAAGGWRGLTLVELLVAMALVAMLLGAGIGLLRSMGRSTELAATERALNALVQRVQAHARTQHSHVELGFQVLTPGGRVRTHLRRPVTHFYFEEDFGERLVTGTGGVRARLERGHIVALGRTGKGVRFGATTAGRVAQGHGEVINPDSRFDCPEGVAIRCDVFIDDFGGTVYLARREQGYFFGIDVDRETGRLYLFGGGTFDGEIRLPRWHEDLPPRVVTGSALARSMEPLPLRRWIAVEMTLDDRGVRFYVDGQRQLSFVPAVESANDVLLALGLGHSAIGRYAAPRRDEEDDEPTREYEPALPETYDPNTGYVWITYVPEGRLDPMHHSRPVVLYLERPSDAATFGLYAPPPEPPSFRLQATTGAVRFGEGLVGRLDNVAIHSLEIGDGLRLPAGLVVAPEPDPEAEESRVVTFDLAGAIR